MKNFEVERNSFISPRLDGGFFVQCLTCKKLFRAKRIGFFELFGQPVCPYCGGNGKRHPLDLVRGVKVY